MSSTALALAKAAKEGSTSDYVFPNAKGGPLSDMAMLAVVRRMEVDVVPHGFRSAFKDWSIERTDYPSELSEVALGHAVGSAVVAAYLRSDMLAKRRALMESWAEFLSKPEPKPTAKPATNVHPITTTKAAKPARKGSRSMNSIRKSNRRAAEVRELSRRIRGLYAISATIDEARAMRDLYAARIFGLPAGVGGEAFVSWLMSEEAGVCTEEQIDDRFFSLGRCDLSPEQLAAAALPPRPCARRSA